MPPSEWPTSTGRIQPGVCDLGLDVVRKLFEINAFDRRPAAIAGQIHGQRRITGGPKAFDLPLPGLRRAPDAVNENDAKRSVRGLWFGHVPVEAYAMVGFCRPS